MGSLCLSDGSRTITIAPDPTPDPDDEDRGGEGSTSYGVLRLRGGPVERGPRVQWEEGTVDNEFLNRKKSKSKQHVVLENHI